MFFGNGETLEQWLRKKDPQGFKGWDGHEIRVHVVNTKAQKKREIICVVLVNENIILHRAYVIDPISEKLMKGDERLLKRFYSEYLPEIFPAPLTEPDAGSTLEVEEKTTEAS